MGSSARRTVPSYLQTLKTQGSPASVGKTLLTAPPSPPPTLDRTQATVPEVAGVQGYQQRMKQVLYHDSRLAGCISVARDRQRHGPSPGPGLGG